MIATVSMLLVACEPSLAAQVDARLEALVSSDRRAIHRFELLERDDALRVTLLSLSGERQHERTVGATGSCADNAAIAAVVLAAWMAEAPRRRPARNSLAGVAGTQPTVVPNDGWGWSLSTDVGATFGGGAAPSATFRFDAGRSFGGVAELSAALDRNGHLGRGTVAWSRTFVGTGLRWRWQPLDVLALEPTVMLAGGALVARGIGFDTVSTSVVPDFGACGAVRLVVGPATFGAFVSARACAWPFAPNVQVLGAGSLQLPYVDATLAVGLLFGGGRG